ncbi:MAG: ABC transporter substrate-binding protein [Chloroflexi bacterium]|nr:ABC transporter substrate-binding protein [Chloroflexota bacterium]
MKQGQTLISFWQPFNPNSPDKTGWIGITKMIDAFEKSNSTIVVQPISVSYSGQMSEKLLTAIAGGQPPDTYYADRFLTATYAHKGIFTDLTSYNAKASVTANQYYQFAWNEATWRGKQWALPFDTDSRLLYMNVTTLQQSGLDPSKPPQTTNDLLDWTARLTKADPATGFSQLGFWPAYDQAFHEVWLVDFGGRFWDEQTHKCTADSAKCVDAFTYMQTYAKRWGQPNVNKFFQSQPHGPENDPFFTGHLAMRYDGVWSLAGIKRYKPGLQFALTPLPSPNGPGGTMAGGFSITLLHGGKHLDQSYTFAKYACGKDGLAIYCIETAHIPTNQEALKNPNYVKFVQSDPNFGKFVDILSKGWNRPVTVVSQDLWNDLGKAQNEVMNLKNDPAVALQGVVTEVNAAYQQAMQS